MPVTPRDGNRSGGRQAVDEPRRPFSVLTVCTGNICRSPLAETWLRECLGPEHVSGVRVASAGVRAVVGSGVCPDMARFADLTGVPVDGFRSRQLTEPMVRESDLVLALSRGHRNLIVEVTPSALRTTFTLREFASLVTDLTQGVLTPDLSEPHGAAGSPPASRLAMLVSMAAARRGQAWRDSPDNDVVDPIGQPPSVAEQAADHIWAAVQTIDRAVRGRRDPAHRA